jgi:hypothetical protein
MIFASFPRFLGAVERRTAPFARLIYGETARFDKRLGESLFSATG